MTLAEADDTARYAKEAAKSAYVKLCNRFGHKALQVFHHHSPIGKRASEMPSTYSSLHGWFLFGRFDHSLSAYKSLIQPLGRRDAKDTFAQCDFSRAYLAGPVLG